MTMLGQGVVGDQLLRDPAPRKLLVCEGQGSGRSVLGVPAGRDPAAEGSHCSEVLLLALGAGGGGEEALLGSPAARALTAAKSLHRRSRSPEVALGIAPQRVWLLGEVTFGRMAAMPYSIRPLTCQAFSDPAASL